VEQPLIHALRIELTRLIDLTASWPDEALIGELAGTRNHPLWTTGHLAFSMQAIAGELGAAPWLPSDWESLFGTGSVPHLELAVYPPGALLRERLEEGVDLVEELLSNTPAEQLSGPLPDVRFRDRYPTLRHAVVHVLGSHFAFHVGQVALWCRALREDQGADS